jgi:hypothetical protein
MDERESPSYAVVAPGASPVGTEYRFPGAGAVEGNDWPAVEDHLVRPEMTRDEMVRGHRIEAKPATPPHADRHFEIDYVIRAHLGEGWTGATELLTRVGPGSDFATDTCIRRSGTDPETGTRYLEELAFEVVNEQSEREITERAEDLSLRGVRRIFAVFVKQGQVCEWSADRQGWRLLDPETNIEDECLVNPLAVRALLEAVAADAAVAQALVAKNNPVIADLVEKSHSNGEKKGHERGLVEGCRRRLVDLCEVIGIELTAERRALIDQISLVEGEDLISKIKTERRWPV